ncbi:MAG: OmpA family protein [Bacteroidales bacterium]|nr:OmpA family protein [Bacteroidales bacterium]
MKSQPHTNIIAKLTLSIVLLFSSLLFAQAQSEVCDVDVSKKSLKLQKKALEELRYGRYSSASQLLQDAIDKSPDNIRALWILADINRRPTNRNRVLRIAKESYQQIIEICPAYENHYAYYYLAGIYYSESDYEKAYATYKGFLAADDDGIDPKHYEEAMDFSMYAKFYADIYANEVEFDPHLLNGVNTSDDEYLPIITPDGEFIYFTRRFQETDRTQAYAKADNSVERFCVARSSGLNNFEKGGPLAKPFNTQSNEGGAALSIDNKNMYFTYCKITGSTGRRSLACDIAYTHFSNGKWSEIEILDKVNRPGKVWESMPTISSDGNTLYFVSNREDGGYGGYDIYKSLKDTSGEWQEAVNLGPSINTAGNEKTPFIHTDSQTLYFSSSSYTDPETGETHNGHLGLGGYDIFYSRLDSTNQWEKPKNIGYPINTKKNDLGFSVSTDGKYGYFSSNKISRNKEANKERNFAQKRINSHVPFNIYSFKLYREARPQKVILVKGSVTEKGSKERVRDAHVYIKNVETKEITEIPIDMETGDFVAAIVTENDLTLMVKKKNYAYVTSYIENPADESEKDIAPIKLDIELKEVEVGTAYDLQDVYFDTDSDVLKEKSVRVIEGFYDFLKDNPNVHVEIQGHTDNVGSDSYNMILSEARAKSVYQVLLDFGIPISQISFKGYGETKPIATNSTSSGKAKNRRTVFVITSK